MATNNIFPWASGTDANVLTDADYASSLAENGTYQNGVQAGQASSKQANKTWRQAVAPASGVAQFIVDNLGVDVSDSDAQSIFSARLTNASIKLGQISPYNSDYAAAVGGYKLNDIVSDDSTPGVYWRSTVGNNLTAPQSSGANWSSLLGDYATEEWVEGKRYAQLDEYANFYALSTTNTLPIADNGNNVPTTYWVNAQGYATQNWVQQRDYTTLSAVANVGYVTGTTTTNVSVSNLQAVNYTGTDNSAAYIQVATAAGTVAIPTNGNVASQISAYAQPKGSYVTNATYASDFGSSGNIWNFAFGNRMVIFQVVATDYQRINFPQSFSSTPVAILITPAQDTDVDFAAFNWDSGGFTIRVVNRGATPFSVVAFGPK